MSIPENINVDSSRSPVERVLLLAWPVLLQQALILAAGLYDRWVAGNYLPSDENLHSSYQAALSTVQYLAWSISCFAVLVSVGSTALVARFIGAGEVEDANRVTNQSIILAIFFGILASLVGLWKLPDLIALLKLDPPSDRLAIEMLQPVILFLVFQMIELSGIACLTGAGDTKPGMLVLGGVAVFNIPMVYLFFHGFWILPAFGHQGITLGTAVSHSIGGLVVLTFLIKGRAGLSLQRRLFKPQIILIKRILRVSIPAAIDSLSVAACQLWFLSLVNVLGKEAATAHGNAIGWEGLGYLSGQAFATAAAALVGQNLGARNPNEAARCGWTAFAMGSICMAVMGLVFYLCAEPMLRLFNPYPHQQPVIDAGVPVLRLVAFAMPALAAIIIFTGALRGAGDTRMPMVATWIGFLLIRMPLAYLFTRSTIDLGSLGTIKGWNLGLIGAWWAMFIDLAIRGALFFWRFSSGRWKKVVV
ncbi:MATE family efflux transporter [Telmatocola sphagniphila]|uniref:Multidrug-efflux transporter n=1 Tax=Telmatocola sphagniphila TaxID=1123043 RepID=A0A8E6B4B7_9BACT|nr:MATE family efflux transporter [Telmatocola sphagniphila]QVL30876.1 MATE family efflux transporter [Telmatocola sphagniphila]